MIIGLYQRVLYTTLWLIHVPLTTNRNLADAFSPVIYDYFQRHLSSFESVNPPNIIPGSLQTTTEIVFIL